MGCGSSKVFVVNEKIHGQGHDCYRDLQKLRLSDDDINTLYTAFLEFDLTGDGTVSLSEFLSTLQIEDSPITKEVFDDLAGKDHVMNFREFALNIWYYCTKDKKAISSMAFDIFDINDNGDLNDEELRLMVTEIYGKKGLSHDMKLIIKKLDKNRDNSISKSEFVGAADKFPALLFPAFHMQTEFQKKIGGEAFWREKSLQAQTIINNPEVAELFIQKKSAQKKSRRRQAAARSILQAEEKSSKSAQGNAGNPQNGQKKKRRQTTRT